VLVPSFVVLQQPYGELLSAKIGRFALLTVLAALNKWRFCPAIGTGNSAALRVLVLMITAIMTAFSSFSK
jgi:putative copper export protein